MPICLSSQPRKRVLSTAIGCALTSLAVPATAATTISTDTVIVAPGDPAESFDVINGAKLGLDIGVATNSILIEAGSGLETSNATVVSTTAAPGVELRNASAIIRNSSTVSSAAGIGLLMGGQAGLSAPTASVISSTISGGQFGISVSSNGVLSLSSSVVSAGTGLSSGLNAGVANFDSTVSAVGGEISGNLSGVLASTTNQTTQTTSTTVLDGVKVSAASGPAILVKPAQAGAGYEGHTATIDISGGTTLSGSNGYALQATGPITANATVDNSNIVGNVGGDGVATVNLTLQNNATLSGDLVNLNSLAVNSGAKWLLANSNTVSAVSMNGGSIDISGAAVGTASNHVLTVGTLSGNGTFLMSTNLGAHTGDLLNVTGNATGAYSLNVRNTGVEPTDYSPLTLVRTGGGGAAFSVVGGKVDAGVYSYRLEQQGNNWALVTDAPPPDGDGDAGSGGDLSPSAETVLGLSGAGPTVWYGEASVLRSRLGELRIGDQSGSGVWVRTFGKQYNAHPADGANYRQTQYGVMGGVDAKVGEAWGGKWLVGVMFGTSHSKLSFENSSTGGVNSYTGGLYATWLGATGWYFDGVLKLNRFQNDADAVMSNGVAAHGSFNNNGIGMTLEFGRHLEFANRWFFEPYVQASMLRVSGDDFTLTNGMTSSTSHTGSVEARIGAAFGRTFELPGGGLLQPYLKIAIAQEFITSNRITVNGLNFNNDESGTRAEIGAGVVGQPRRNLQLYAEVETGTGRRISQPWGAQIGVRYAF